MKTRHLLLLASLLIATACEAAVTDGPAASSTTGDVELGTSAGSSSAGQSGPQTTASSTSGVAEESSSSSGSPGSSDTVTTSEGSSSTGALVECGSPLLDTDDRLQLARSPMRGNPDALVTLVVWTGYADPFSASVQDTLAALAGGPQGDELRIVSKQMPLAFQDPRGRLARAGLAAHALGAYWDFHDAMFASDQDLEPKVVDSIALEVGLDLDAFHTAMESDEVAAQLAADMALLEAVGASGTPSSLINGELVVGAQPLGGFEDVVASQRATMDLLIEDGLPVCVAFEQRLDEQLP